jgi:hypothetical protein
MTEQSEHGCCGAAKHELLHEVIHGIPLRSVVLIFLCADFPEERSEQRLLIFKQSWRVIKQSQYMQGGPRRLVLPLQQGTTS